MSKRRTPWTWRGIAREYREMMNGYRDMWLESEAELKRLRSELAKR